MSPAMTRRNFIGGAAALAATGIRPLFADTDAAELAAAKRWFKETQFGMMAHWGLYTLLGGEWQGKPGLHEYGEWIMHGNRIPLRDYAGLAKAFNPILFDPNDWIARARDAGMGYFVITSKHHDGFAMYRSKVSRYNVVDATPFGRDPMEAIAEACRKYGVNKSVVTEESIEPVRGIRLAIRFPEKPSALRLQPEGHDLAFAWTDGAAVVEIPEVAYHSTIEKFSGDRPHKTRVCLRFRVVSGFTYC